MWRGVLKLLVWMLGVVIGVMVSGASLDASLVAALLLSLSASALCEWSMPRWYASLAPMCILVASVSVPALIPFVPLSTCDAGLILGGSRQQQKMYTHADTQARLRLLRWTLYAVCLAAVVSFLVRPDIAGLGLRSILALLSLLAFGLGVTLETLKISAFHAQRAQDAYQDALRRIHADKLEMEEERSRSVRHATLLERTRIAREIHDSVGHLLTRGIMQAHAARIVAQSADDEQTVQSFNALEETIVQAMTMVRESVHDLDERGNDFSRQIELAAHCLDLTGVHESLTVKASGVGIQVHLDNRIIDAPVAVTRCLAMTIREALNNTVRHSSARHVSIGLRDMPALWQLVVQDDGDADDPVSGRRPHRAASPHDWSGMGLADIELRAQGLGGSALCGPYGSGWRVFVSIPKNSWQGEAASEHRMRDGERLGINKFKDSGGLR